MDPRPLRPGLVKVRAAPLVRRRVVQLSRAEAGPVRDLIEAADVVSEGRTEIEGGGLVYYGSTSVLLLRRGAGGTLPDGDVHALADALRGDPHVRVRALRIAHREATARAGGPLGTVVAVVGVAASARGVSLLVEVVARLARGDVQKAPCSTAGELSSSAGTAR